MSPESAEFWKSIFEIAGVILLALTFLAGSGFWYFGRRVNEFQEERLRKFDKDLTTAKDDLSIQQQRAAEAEKQLELVKQSSANAEKDVARANQRAGEANEKAAEANKAAEALRQKNLQLEKEVAPRILGIRELPDGKTNVDGLKEFAGAKVILISIHDAEALHASGSIKWLLEKAGLNVVVTVPVDPFFQSVKISDGVTLIPAKEGDAAKNARLLQVLFRVLSEQGWKEIKPRQGDTVPDWKEFVILVGFKPPAYELLK